MENEFKRYAGEIKTLGDAELVGVLKHTKNGVDIQLQFDGNGYDVLWLAAMGVYRLHELSDIPLEELGKQLNGIIETILETEESGAMAIKLNR